MAEKRKLLEILEVAERMNSAQETEGVLEVVADAAAHLVSADRVSIFLLDAENLELKSSIARGTDQPLRFDARLGIAGAAAMSGETVNVENAQEDSRFYSQIDEVSGYTTRTVLAVPIVEKEGNVLGVFEVLNKKNGKFSREDERILTALSSQAAVAIRNAELIDTLKKENLRLKGSRLRGTQRLIGTSPQIQAIVRLIDTIRDCSVSVLITGESGTGKELVARAIHESSRRRNGPFVALNSAALPENLLESELFGIEEGVATGVTARKGRFEEASGGTLFLDEIGDLSLSSQAKILRALQEKVVQPVGADSLVEVDCRVVAATHRELSEAIQAGEFRKDLYFRLKVVHIHTPALREIRSDIPLLARKFLDACCKEMGRPPKELNQDALQRLRSHNWPGNVRELENEMKRLAASLRKRTVSAEDLQLTETVLPTPDSPPPDASLKEIVADRVTSLETRLIQEALEAHQFNQVKTAQALGLSRQGLLKKIKRYGILGKS